MLKFYIFIFSILFSQFAVSQLPDKMFEQQWLDNPVAFYNEIENCFQYNEIDTFRYDSAAHSVLLVNGYAKYAINNKSNWKLNVKGRKIKTITIVFTKYPFKKEDWITNYYELAANRLKELFSIDSTLNSNEIRWKLLLQNNCKTGKEAEKMLHGILINYEIVKIKEQKSKPIIKTKRDTNFIKEVKWDDYFFNEQPKKVKKRGRTYLDKKKEKKKKTKEPKCADFGEKKRWLRIFRKR